MRNKTSTFKINLRKYSWVLAIPAVRRNRNSAHSVGVDGRRSRSLWNLRQPSALLVSHQLWPEGGAWTPFSILFNSGTLNFKEASLVWNSASARSRITCITLWRSTFWNKARWGSCHTCTFIWPRWSFRVPSVKPTDWSSKFLLATRHHDLLFLNKNITEEYNLM